MHGDISNTRDRLGGYSYCAVPGPSHILGTPCDRPMLLRGWSFPDPVAFDDSNTSEQCAPFFPQFQHVCLLSLLFLAFTFALVSVEFWSLCLHQNCQLVKSFSFSCFNASEMGSVLFDVATDARVVAPLPPPPPPPPPLAHHYCNC